MPVDEGVSAARREIAIFLAFTLGLSSVLYALIIRGGGLAAGGGLYVMGLMWSPGVAAILTCLFTRRRLGSLGWGWGRTRYQVWSYVLPVLYAGVVYAVVWLTGLGGFGEVRSGLVGFLVMGSLTNLLFALGEEIGWRGFLVPRLREVTSFGNTALLSGLIWFLWHTPLIVAADYNSGTPTWFALLCFMVLIVGISVPMAWLRLVSGSLWTGAILHASHNLYIQAVFDPMTTDTGPTEWITGEFGAGLAISGLVVGWIFWRLGSRLLEVGQTDAASRGVSDS